MSRVKKEAVLKGIEHRERVPVPELGKDGYLLIRPLTDAEALEVKRVLFKDRLFQRVAKDDVDLVEVINRDAEAKALALSIALSVDDEKWMPEDVQKLPGGVPERLYEVLSKISGLAPKTPTEEAKDTEAPLETKNKPMDIPAKNVT